MVDEINVTETHEMKLYGAQSPKGWEHVMKERKTVAATLGRKRSRVVLAEELLLADEQGVRPAGQVITVVQGPPSRVG